MHKNTKLIFQTAQNKKIRYILNYDKCEYLYFKDFSKIGYLSVEKRHDFLSINMMHSIYYGLVSSYLCNFTRIENVHSRDTRHSAMPYILQEITRRWKKKILCAAVLNYGMDCQ